MSGVTYCQGWDDGCCAVLVVLVQDTVYVANLGDSKALLCRQAGGGGDGQKEEEERVLGYSDVGGDGGSGRHVSPRAVYLHRLCLFLHIHNPFVCITNQQLCVRNNHSHLRHRFPWERGETAPPPSASAHFMTQDHKPLLLAEKKR